MAGEGGGRVAEAVEMGSMMMMVRTQDGFRDGGDVVELVGLVKR